MEISSKFWTSHLSGLWNTPPNGVLGAIMLQYLLIFTLYSLSRCLRRFMYSGPLTVPPHDAIVEHLTGNRNTRDLLFSKAA
jgi:hypothetical protein